MNVSVKRTLYRICVYVIFIHAHLCFSVLSARAAGDEAIGGVRDIKFEDAKAVDQFYLDMKGESFWIKDGEINRRGKDLLTIVKQSWMNGLNPEHYHLSEIEKLVMAQDSGEDNGLRLELLLTDAYVRYVRDMGGMRIRAKDLQLDPKSWRVRPDSKTVLANLSAHGNDVAEYLISLEPQSTTYQKIKSELVHLIENAEEKEKDSPLSFKGIVRPGDGAHDIPRLRTRFGLVAASENDRYRYDEDLVQAVMTFQQDKGLKPDGIIGSQTLSMLNMTKQDKIRQLVVNLERLRWVDEEKPGRFIIVNLPSATLWTVEDGRVTNEMPVVVGRKKRATQSFVTLIHGVRFNPTWTVPLTIKKEDIVPQLIENPLYLQDKGIEVYDGQQADAPTIDPTIVDWHNVTEKDLMRMRMVQIPGDHNPLGRIRILMPNTYDIYLHDTNHPELFSKLDRAQSSGCIRLERPEEIARFVLKNYKGFDDKKMMSVLESGTTKDYYVQEKIPVYVLYQTVWLGDKGQIVYGQDIYGNDLQLWNLLENLDRKGS